MPPAPGHRAATRPGSNRNGRARGAIYLAMRGDCVAFASHWQPHNYRILTESGPLWISGSVPPDQVRSTDG